jgi:hypothetical protein
VVANRLTEARIVFDQQNAHRSPQRPGSQAKLTRT